MQNSACTKPLSLELLDKWVALYFCQRLEVLNHKKIKKWCLEKTGTSYEQISVQTFRDKIFGTE